MLIYARSSSDCKLVCDYLFALVPQGLAVCGYGLFVELHSSDRNVSVLTLKLEMLTFARNSGFLLEPGHRDLYSAIFIFVPAILPAG